MITNYVNALRIQHGFQVSIKYWHQQTSHVPCYNKNDEDRKSMGKGKSDAWIKMIKWNKGKTVLWLTFI